MNLKIMDFKNRKVVHYTLLSSIIILQLLLLIILYNEIFNEAKLRELQVDLDVSEKAKYFSELTKDDYIAAQYNLQNYIQTKDEQYLINYNNALNSLNKNIQSLAETSDKSDLFTSYLNRKSHSNLSVKNINNIIDSLRSIEIAPDLQEQEDLIKLKNFNYDMILDSISVESSIVVDSVQHKGLLHRLGDAISGKVNVQKEKENIVLTIKQGKDVTSGTMEEQLTRIFKNTNEYYQKEFTNYKNHLEGLKEKETGFFNQNQELLNYSHLLLNKYNDALIYFTNDAKVKFEDQYRTNKLIRYYTVIGLIILLVVISAILTLLTRLTFSYEKRLLTAKAKIKENLSFKNRIVGMISHEIRAPLNMISIHARNIVRQVNDKDIKDSLKSIQFVTTSLSLLANQILDFSKNENRKMKLNKNTFDLKDELDEILKTLGVFVKSQGNTFIVENGVTEHIKVYSDATKIQQLFHNIVGNANKFTKKGNILISVTPERSAPDKLKLFIKVRDDGIGIHEEDLKYIFESYHQPAQVANIKNIGTGLGLYLCREIIELFDGEIEITSKKNIETIVSFTLVLDLGSE
ncbi:MAG TPA: HAMP domain-containing sensor histidine kinase [Flavobacterium sp.]|nr:HAMP domain-containing sensor histidine kinase [Flavobacterium sp.]